MTNGVGGSTGVQASEVANGFLSNLHEMNWFLIAISFLGAVLLYIIAKNNNKPPFSLFKALNIKMNENTPWYVISLDIILISFLGSVAVYFFAAPTTPAQAFASGLGFVGIMCAVKDKD